MTVILMNNLLLRHSCFHPFSRAAILEHFFYRRYSCPTIRIKMHEAHIDYDEAENRFLCSLHYTNPTLKVDRTFNFNRSPDETIAQFLRRLDTSIRNVAFKKVKKRKNPETTLLNIINKDNVRNDKIVIMKGKEELDGMLPCSKILTYPDPTLKLCIFGEEYTIKYNVPKITLLTLSDHIIATFPTYPVKLEGKNMCKEKSNFTWFKSCKNKNKVEWVQVGEGYVYTPTNAEIGSLLKLTCEPKNDKDSGAILELVANEAVIAPPNNIPFERRHEYTKEKLSGDKFRVVTYNILADMYSDSTYSKNVLFPYCPEYALNMDYRKNFIIKELMGYNADIICLQEVDKKVFARDLNIVLSLASYKGIYNNKPNVEEGLAIFFNKTRFILLFHEYSLMSENTNSLSDFKEVWSQVQNEKTKAAFLQRPNIVQAVALQSKEDPSRILLVGNTHLYFHPMADNIRLLQAYFAITYLRMKAKEIKQQIPDAIVNLVFCGDFNSSPIDGIFKLFTCNYLPANSADWKTSQEDIVENISLKQDIRFGSACGTPEYTNFTTIFSGCLDYIFYDRDNLAVEQSVPMPTLEELTNATAIPSPVFPSDHISLCADLKYVK